MASSMIDKFKANLSGNKAYKEHATANRLVDTGRHEEAKPHFDRALELYSVALEQGCDKTGILMAYSLLLLRNGKNEEARELMLRVDSRQDLSATDKRQLRINYAVCQWKLGDLDKAIDLMKQAGESLKTSIIYNTLGLFLIEKAIQTGDFDEAITFNQEAYEYDDEDGDTLDNMGQLYLAISQKEALAGNESEASENRSLAESFFDRAIERKPGLVTALYYKGRMLFENGNPEKARELLDRALEGRFSTLCPICKQQVQELLDQIGES